MALKTLIQTLFFILIFNMVNPLVSYANNSANEAKYEINLSDWPKDVVEKMKKDVSELNETYFTAEALNIILKKLDQNMQFNSLKFVKTGISAEKKTERNVQEVRLIGEISATIEKIEFEGLEEVSEAEALSMMNINFKNALDEDNLKSAADKLTQYYRELGYRSAEVKFETKNISTIKKLVLFIVNPKKQTKLTEIKIDGIDEQTKADIVKQNSFLFIKPVLNQETLNKLSISLRRQLSMHGYFLTQVPSPQIIFSADELSAKVLFKLKKTQRYSVEIVNAEAFSHIILEDDVLKLDTFYSKDSNYSAELVDKLKQFYMSFGYPHLNISLYERKEGDKIITTLNLDEGPFVELTKLKITGQLSRNEEYYKEKFYNLASLKLQSKFYIKEDIEQAAKNLLVELQNEGFVSARLGRVQVSTDRESPKDGMAIIQIDEGPQLTVGSIDFVGIQALKKEKLTEIINLHVNEPLSLTQLELALQNLKNYYTNLGYIEYKLLNEQKDLMTYAEKNTKALLKFEIQEGPKVEVQSILIEGNDRTKDNLIKTEIDFKPGDALTPAKIDESISRLQRTGHFSSIDITTVEAGSAISQRTVLIKVTERDPGVFTVGGGATNENNGTLHGFMGIAYRNFEGMGRGLSLRFEPNYNFADVRYLESKFTLGGVYPYLFDSRARLRANVTRSRSISDYSIRKVTELNSGVISLEQDFTSHFTGIWDLWSVTTYIDHGITTDDEIQYGYTREDSVIGATGPTLDFDYRDNLFNPTKGSFTRFSLEYASDFLSSNKVDDYVRATAQSTWYFPFRNASVIFAQSLQGGYIKDVAQTGYGIPFDKKGFFLGGRSTIRGFGSSEFFPSTDLINGDLASIKNKLTTSASYKLVKSELRFPLVNKWDLGGALFYDGGQVLIEGLDLKNKWRDAVGLGLRYNTPIGPLNLEYGQKIDKKSGEDTGAFHLSIGVF